MWVSSQKGAMPNGSVQLLRKKDQLSVKPKWQKPQLGCQAKKTKRLSLVSSQKCLSLDIKPKGSALVSSQKGQKAHSSVKPNRPKGSAWMSSQKGKKAQLGGQAKGLTYRPKGPTQHHFLGQVDISGQTKNLVVISELKQFLRWLFGYTILQ